MKQLIYKQQREDASTRREQNGYLYAKVNKIISVPLKSGPVKY